ncbi:hypothetical protein [Granulicella tundricola]|uniref:Uncharacterized protein n=1 Tax=Granulicella tundricola (strain ATCC BAA-1859 / DSM 23138 / MP5ACTX9) TaxID=1198114 RepID=E8X0P9_GRATM|nr:hypothetical protein [Granulicella tundricola]ADW69000.1 hypothetical protein AciX9_1954 [Granulicella tundricola MP5ACTX9]
MANTSFVKTANERRYISKGDNAADGSPLLEAPHPLSLSMNAHVIFANAVGDPDAKALVEEWRPRFIIRAATSQEVEAWH